MHNKKATLGLFAATALLLAGCTSPQAPGGADDPSAPGNAGSDLAATCEVLAGKTVELIVPYSTGGGFDILARLVAPGLANAIGARVIVVNQPGAGGLLAITQLTQARTDGTQVAIMNGSGTAASVLVGAEGVDFTFDDLSFVGRVSVDDLILITAADGPYQSWEDIQDSTGFRFGSTGRGASDYITGALLIETFDLDGAELVAGFAGQAESELALLQHNIDGFTGPLDGRRAGIVSGENTGVLSFSTEQPADAPDATLVSELDLDARQQTLIDGHNLINEIGRAIVAPAGIDSDALQCLRDGLEYAITEDPETLAQAEAIERYFSFLSGDELQSEVIDNFDQLPTSYLDLLRNAF